MKNYMLCIKLVTFLLTTISINVVYSQSVGPFLSDGKQWNVLYNEFCGPMQPEKYTTTCYKIEGDTLLDGFSYKRMYSTIYSDLTNWSLNSILREDDDKVYYREYLADEVFTDENLLYDFSLQPGDSIPIDSYNDYLVLDSVCDIVVGNDTLRKYCFYYSIDGFHSDDTEFWIEGIGSECGVVHVGDVIMMGGNNTLLCYFYNEELLWHNEYFDTCFYNNLGMYENENDNISVYPNPAKDHVRIELSDNSASQSIEIYSLDGRLVETFQETSLHDNTIDISGLNAGMYIMKIRMADGREYEEKIIIQ